MDGVAQGFDVGGGGVASVDEGQGVTGGDSGVALLEAFGEAGFFEQPGGGEFSLAFGGGPVGNGVGGLRCRTQARNRRLCGRRQS